MNRRHAFTLIELLVVISIIAVLIAILLPALESTKRTTKLAICGSHEHQLSLGMHAYAVDNGGLFPGGSGFPGYTRRFPWVAPGLTSNSGSFTLLHDDGYINDREAFLCPDGWMTDPDAFPYQGISVAGNTNFRYFNGSAWYMAIGYNIFANAGAYMNLYEDVPINIEDPADWVLITDDVVWGNIQKINWQQAHVGFLGDSGSPPIFPPKYLPWLGTNVTSVDGSVRTRAPGETEARYPLFAGGAGSRWWARF